MFRMFLFKFVRVPRIRQQATSDVCVPHCHLRMHLRVRGAERVGDEVLGEGEIQILQNLSFFFDSHLRPRVFAPPTSRTLLLQELRDDDPHYVGAVPSGD